MSPASVEEEVDARETAGMVDDFLAALASEDRILFVRRYWYFDTIPELSARFGFSQSKVKTTLFRLRQGLKEHLEKEGYSI